MNESEFLKIIGMIDDDIIEEADIYTDKKSKKKLTVSKRSFYAFCSAAAAAVVTFSVVFYNSHVPSYYFNDNSISQTDSSSMNDNTTISNICTEAEDSVGGTDISAEIGTDKSNFNELRDTKTGIVNKNDMPTSAKETKLTDIQTNNNDKELQVDTDQIKAAVNYFQMFEMSFDNGYDAYGEDELRYVSVIISGNSYQQLDILEYSDYNIDPEISESDFGEYIGNVTELFELSDSSDYAVSSKEPNIAGAETYYYAPANSRTVIIVKKGGQCSIFTFNGMTASSDGNVSDFAETFRYYGAETKNDIQSVYYSIDVPRDSTLEVISQGTITDRDIINSIIDILYQLTPENSSSNRLAGSPQWLIDAWDEYRTNPDDFEREDITINIAFNNGTVLKDISYQPYLGNGCIYGMQELTAEQNAALRELFK